MNRILQGLMVAVTLCSLAWLGGSATQVLAAGIGQQGVARDAGAGGNGNKGNGTNNSATDSNAGNGPTDTRDAGTPDVVDGGSPEFGFRTSSRSTVVE